MNSPSTNILALLDLIGKTPHPKTLDQARTALASITKSAQTVRVSLASDTVASRVVRPSVVSAAVPVPGLAWQGMPQTPPPLTLAQFNALTPAQKMDWSVKGGRLIK